MKKIILIILSLIILVSCAPTQTKCIENCDEPPQKLGLYDITIDASKEKYNFGEKTAIIIKNNEKENKISIAGHPCYGDYYSIQNELKQPIQLEGPYKIALCYPEKLDTILPGEEKTVDLWDQKYYDSKKDRFLQAPAGRYTLTLNRILITSVNSELILYEGKVTINITIANPI